MRERSYARAMQQVRREEWARGGAHRWRAREVEVGQRAIVRTTRLVGGRRRGLVKKTASRRACAEEALTVKICDGRLRRSARGGSGGGKVAVEGFSLPITNYEERKPIVLVQPQQSRHQSRVTKPAQQGVADIDVLWILKSDHRFNTSLHPIGDQVFEQMFLTTQCITDTTHPYRFVAHNDMPITTMEDVVAYNLLIQVHGHDREKAFDMVLILKNQTIPSINAQMIGDLLGPIWDRADCHLLVFIINEKVIDTLRIFTLAAPDDNMRVLDFGESCKRTIDDERGSWSGGFEESEMNWECSASSLYAHEHEQRWKGDRNGDDRCSRKNEECVRTSNLI
ncbi:hypothetical protein Scep_008909 [Stephania cephalantha]|uniref:Uncharacterized protein n=1 Tax=Stephania cephalantha TaxID=152367 RepID=A0AAP0JS66_9MAGN